MNETQRIEKVEKIDLLAKVDSFFMDGWRLVQIHSLRLAGANGEPYNEINYSFGRKTEMVTLKLDAPLGEAIPSVTRTWAGAFHYENEMMEQFDVKIDRVSVNYHGGFYAAAKPTHELKAPKPQAGGDK